MLDLWYHLKTILNKKLTFKQILHTHFILHRATYSFTFVSRFPLMEATPIWQYWIGVYCSTQSKMFDACFEMNCLLIGCCWHSIDGFVSTVGFTNTLYFLFGRRTTLQLKISYGRRKMNGVSKGEKRGMEPFSETDSAITDRFNEIIDSLQALPTDDDYFVTKTDIIFTFVSMCGRLYSIISTILLSSSYYRNGKIDYFTWTLCCFFIPMAITTVLQLQM